MTRLQGTLADVDPNATRIGLTVQNSTRPSFLIADENLQSGQPSCPGEENALPDLADYEILGEVGRGAVGVVYKARHRLLGRVVALKVILAGQHIGKVELARFRNEAEVVARLQHPNIVQIYELGWAGTLPFCALEYCPGGSLHDLLRQSPLTPQRAVGFVEKVARAVHAAHEAGIIHRDLKPGNILLDADGQPKVADFGLAKRLNDERITQSGAVLGTPSYMAPEQACGNNSRVGPTSDIYALGAIFYELLTGRPPFKGTSVSDTLVQVIFEETLPPRKIRSSIPRDLETICLRCLEKDPSRRYQRAVDLANDLARFQAGQNISIRPVGRLEQTWRWCRRNPVVASLVVLVLLTLTVGSVASALLAWHALDEAARADNNAQALAQKVREESRARAQALDALAEARTQRQAAEDNLRRAEWLLYQGQLREASQALREGNASLALQRLEECRWDFRGWEHHHLWTLVNSKPRSPLDHGTSITCLALSRQMLLASGGADGTVKLWDAQTGELKQTLRAHAGSVSNVLFSPNGQLLATAAENVDRWGGLHRVVELADSRPGEIKLWEIPSGKELRTLKGHRREVTGIAFSLDGLWLASSSQDRTVKMWDVQKGTEVCTFRGHEGEVGCVLFSRDGRRLISGGWDHTLRIWEIASGSEVGLLRGHVGKVFALALSPDGQRLVSGGQDRTIKVWHLESGRELLALRGHGGFITALVFTPDGSRLVSTGQDGMVKFWEGETGQELLTLRGHQGLVAGLAFYGAGDLLVSGGDEKLIRFWDASWRQKGLLLSGHSGQVLAAAFSPDGRRLASGGEDRTIKIRDAFSGRQIRTLRGHESQVTSVVFEPQGEFLTSGDASSSVCFWKPTLTTDFVPLRGLKGAVQALVFDPTGKHLAIGTGDSETGTGEIHLLTFAGNSASLGEKQGALLERQILPLQPQRVLQLAFSPRRAESPILAARTGNWEKFASQLSLWDANTGRFLRLLPTTDHYATGLAFSPDGLNIAATLIEPNRINALLKVWQTDNGTLLRSHKLDLLPSSLAWSSDGTIFAIGHENGAITLRRADTLAVVRTLHEHTEPVIGLTFSADGRRLLSLAHDGTCRIWTVKSHQSPAD